MCALWGAISCRCVPLRCSRAEQSRCARDARDSSVRRWEQRSVWGLLRPLVCQRRRAKSTTGQQHVPAMLLLVDNLRRTRRRRCWWCCYGSDTILNFGYKKGRRRWQRSSSIDWPSIIMAPLLQVRRLDVEERWPGGAKTHRRPRYSWEQVDWAPDSLGDIQSHPKHQLPVPQRPFLRVVPIMETIHSRQVQGIEWPIMCFIAELGRLKRDGRTRTSGYLSMTCKVLPAAILDRLCWRLVIRWTANLPMVRSSCTSAGLAPIENSPTDTSALYDAISTVSGTTQVDARLILAVVVSVQSDNQAWPNWQPQ